MDAVPAFGKVFINEKPVEGNLLIGIATFGDVHGIKEGALLTLCDGLTSQFQLSTVILKL